MTPKVVTHSSMLWHELRPLVGTGHPCRSLPAALLNALGEDPLTQLSKNAPQGHSRRKRKQLDVTCFVWSHILTWASSGSFVHFLHIKASASFSFILFFSLLHEQYSQTTGWRIIKKTHKKREIRMRRLFVSLFCCDSEHFHSTVSPNSLWLWYFLWMPVQIWSFFAYRQSWSSGICD